MFHSRATANVPSRKFAANVEESRYGVGSTGVTWDGPARRRRPMQEQQTVAQRSTRAIVNPIIRLHEADNVVVARTTLLPGTPIANGVIATQRIPPGHKVAARRIE